MFKIDEIVNKLYESKNSNSENEEEVKICRESVIDFIHYMRYALFFDYFSDVCSKENLENVIKTSYEHLKTSFGEFFTKYESKVDEVYCEFPKLKEMLLLDIQAIFEGDPAANSKFEIISTYPGFLAIFSYRIAHEFYIRDMKFVARTISEYAHSRTGIDINPGAAIGKSFFIDHGTGVVIGETSNIGDNCKIYQGVTLGALSLKEGRKLKTVKRHPTLLNNVIIYSGASIFGGKTVIGNNVVVGSNVEIKESVPDNTIVRGNSCSEIKH